MVGALILATAFLSSGGAQTFADEPAKVMVFAASSLTVVLSEIAAAWRQGGHGDVILSFAASSALAKQIEQGAPADIFASADPAWMNYLVERQLIDTTTIHAGIGNELVWVVPPDASSNPGLDLAARLGQGRLAIADPDHVPAGKYAKQALMNMGVWDQVQDRLARTENVRAALSLVERGEVPIGIVYATDARESPVRIVAAIPPKSHFPIVYPIAIVAGRQNPASRAFLDFAMGPKGIDIFRDNGFVIRD